MTMHVQSCTRRLINVVAFKQLNYYFMVNFIFFFKCFVFGKIPMCNEDFYNYVVFC